MASIFLVLIVLTSIAVIVNKQLELNSALNQYSTCTQKVLQLTKESGTGQVKELRELRNENKQLILLKGECIVYKKNVNTTTTTSMTAEKHTDDLMDMIKKRDEQVIAEGEEKKECGKLLKTCKDEAALVKEKLQEVDSERDRMQTKHLKCSDELTACQQAGTPSG